MKTFTYNEKVKTVSQMQDAIAYCDEHPLEVVAIEDVGQTRYSMRGEPDPKNGNHHYIAGTLQDLREDYERIQGI